MTNSLLLLPNNKELIRCELDIAIASLLNYLTRTPNIDMAVYLECEICNRNIR